MQSPDHMNLCDTHCERFPDRCDDVSMSVQTHERHLFRGKRAKLAGKNAEIRIIDVAIQDVRRDVPVLCSRTTFAIIPSAFRSSER